MTAQQKTKRKQQQYQQQEQPEDNTAAAAAAATTAPESNNSPNNNTRDVNNMPSNHTQPATDADHIAISDSIIQSLSSIDLFSLRNYQEEDKIDCHLIISPKTQMGMTFYYHSGLNPALRQVINNVNPAQLARVVFQMCHHFHIGPLYWDDLDPHATDSSEQTMSSITELMPSLNLDKVSQCFSGGVWRNKSIVGGGGGDVQS